MNYDLTIVIPTFNEKDNIRRLRISLEKALVGINWEAVFVDDDSTDGTSEEVQNIALEYANIRLIRRIGRRGLSSACIEGMMSSMSPNIAVIDADMQHDEKLLPKMFDKISTGSYDVIIGSRFVRGGSTGELQSERVHISKFASLLSRLTLKINVTDPMSGLFMITQDTRNNVARSLSGVGYKILLDILINGSNLRVLELPYAMRGRLAGESKLDILVAFELIQLIVENTVGKIIPTKFILFVLVGMIGILVHLLVLGAFLRLSELDFLQSQSLAIITAMTGNFFLNNLFTYRDRRLKGLKVFRGLVSFYAACSLGALINLMIAETLNAKGVLWLLAGSSGAFVGAVWNYTMTSMFTWGRRRSQ